jgi:hypothetical protein
MTLYLRPILLPSAAVSMLALMAFALVPGTLNPGSYAAIVAVSLAVAMITIRTYTHAHETQSLAHLVSQADPGITDRRSVRSRS